MNYLKATGPNLNGIPICLRLRSRYIRKEIAKRPRAPHRNVSDTASDLFYGMPRQLLVSGSNARARLERCGFKRLSYSGKSEQTKEGGERHSPSAQCLRSLKHGLTART